MKISWTFTISDDQEGYRFLAELLRMYYNHLSDNGLSLGSDNRLSVASDNGLSSEVDDGSRTGSR